MKYRYNYFELVSVRPDNWQFKGIDVSLTVEKSAGFFCRKNRELKPCQGETAYREILKELGLSDTAITKLITRGLEDQREKKEQWIGLCESS